ncbi:YccF domain-containing protein [bacterium]|nr:YccF domain-containing protein [bacterium]
MSTLGNILWLIFGGLTTAISYITVGIGYCVTIIGIPWGIQAIKIGIASLLPFGMEVRTKRDSGGLFELIANLIWVVLAGWAIALHHLVWALLLAITVVGLPFAAQHMKLVPLSLFPFGKELR